jgi:hypothetical protein
MDLNNSYSACVPLWYRLLSCGFHLSASAGTDCFLNRVVSRLPGSDRAYVRVDGDFTYEKWIEGLRLGRSFVTNGPFVEIIANGTKRSGDTVLLTGPGKVKIQAKAWWQLALRRAELVQDGKVIATKEFPANGPPAVDWEQEVQFERSSWVALRCSGPAHADNPGGEAFAHTSPIYVDVPGRPPLPRDEAEYFLKWIDRLDVALRERNRFPTPAQRAQALAQLESARAVYAKMANR